MIWVCPSCDLEFQPGWHDLARCRWQQELEMAIFQYALLRAAYQAADETEREVLSDLAKKAEAGDASAHRMLNRFMLDIVRTQKKTQRSAAAH